MSLPTGILSITVLSCLMEGSGRDIACMTRWAVWQPLFEPLYETAGDVTFLHKGERSDVEEYSIFRNKEASERIRSIVSTQGIDRIDICGIAGDVCVHDSLVDGIGIFSRDMFRVLTQYSPSLDGGRRLLSALS